MPTPKISTPLTWIIAGGGDKTHALCGVYNSKYDQCPTKLEGHLYNPFRFNCKKASCPNCYEPKIAQQAHFAYERFKDVRKIYYLNGHDLSWGELILSPPERIHYMFEEKNDLEQIRKYALDLAESAGVIGGMMVIHPYRGRHKYMQQIREGLIEGKPSYHIHIIALRMPYGWEKSNDLNLRTSENPSDRSKTNRATGWTYKWVDEKTKNGKQRNMYEKIYYELEHAGISNDGNKYGQIASWTGICSRRAVKQLKTTVHEPVTCPVCQQQALRWALDGEACQGPAERKIVHVAHTIEDQVIERARTRYELTPGDTRREDLSRLIEPTEKGVIT